MPKGRKPIPNRIKLLRGNPGKRPLNMAAPQWTPVSGTPEWLDGFAKQEWDEIAPDLMAQKMLTRAGQAAFACYCVAVGNMRTALEYLHGSQLLGVQDGKPTRHPAYALLREAMADVRSFASEFGFTPASATKVAQGAKPAPDSLDEFLLHAG